MVVTRFAPSPTGYLHLGGARTALFARAFARQQGGKFYLRIEDTDAARSSAARAQEIIRAMQWLGLDYDGEAVLQSARTAVHKRAAERLLAGGKAYYCYCAPEELEARREAARASGQTPKYDRRCRNANHPPRAGAAIRFKFPLNGQTTAQDLVKGELRVDNETLDDFVICRADGGATYNLAAAADDVDMGVTHIARGDDHIMNTFRQQHIFAALGAAPVFAHLPLILAPVGGQAGAYERMSKRNAAVDIMQYERDGFLPEAALNYLARLGWGHGDAEVFGMDFFTREFSFAAVSPAAARFDIDKLRWLNREHIRRLPPQEFARRAKATNLSAAARALLQERAANLCEAQSLAALFAARPPPNAALLAKRLPAERRAAFASLQNNLAALEKWEAASIKDCIKQTAAAAGLKFPDLAMPLRIALFATEQSPDIAAAAAALGREECMARLLAAQNATTA